MDRRTRFTTPFVRAAACALFALGANSALPGQEPQPPAPRLGVRIYFGGGYVERPAAALEPAPAPPAKGVEFELLPPPLPEVAAGQPPDGLWSAPKGIFRPAGGPGPGRAKPAPLPGAAGENKGGRTSHPAPPADTGAPVVARPLAEGRPAPASPEPAWHGLLLKLAVVQVLSVLAGLGLCCLVLGVALRRVLRRAERDRHSVLRVEVVNGLPAMPAGPAPAPAAAAQEGPAPAPDAAGEGPDLPSTAEPFELGPTYEEERRAREEAERLKDEALLRQVYEENLRLRDRLGQAEGEAPAEAGAEAVGAGQAPAELPFGTYRYDESGAVGGPGGGEEPGR